MANEDRLPPAADDTQRRFDIAARLVDDAGNADLTEVETTAVGILPADLHEYHHDVVADRIIWPDGISLGRDGYLSASAAQVSRAAV